MMSITPGNYIIKVSKTGYATAAAQVSIAPETALTKNFVLAKQEIASGTGWKRGKPDKISPEKAREYFASKSKRTSLKSATAAPLAGLSAPAAITPEIQELARALRYDPKLIYHYVHNNIDYLPYYGSHKGATLTYLEGSGNDFDQASLLIALLRESGAYNNTIGEVTYVSGVQVCWDYFLSLWLGVNAGTPVGDALSKGGIPVAHDDQFVRVERVWVSATISGVNYQLDPAFKFYSYTNRASINTAMGYDLNSFITAATSGATITNDYVANISEAGINGQLAAYANNLVNFITSGVDFWNKDVKDIYGGRDIRQETTSQFPTSYFMALSMIPMRLADWLTGLAFSRYIILAIILAGYLVLGCFLDATSMMVLTLPVIFPTILKLGFDPIWFGVISVLMMEAGLITPPLGLNVFVISGVADVPIEVVFRGAIYFLLAIIAVVVLITVFPQIATVLPNMMR